MLNYKLPNGQYMIPVGKSFRSYRQLTFRKMFSSRSRHISSPIRWAVADVDYLVTKKDTLSLKYYYQHDPTRAPFGYSSVEGFTQNLDAGSQVARALPTRNP